MVAEKERVTAAIRAAEASSTHKSSEGQSAMQLVRTAAASWQIGLPADALVESLESVMDLLDSLGEQGKTSELALLGMALRHCGGCELLVAMLQPAREQSVQAVPRNASEG